MRVSKVQPLYIDDKFELFCHLMKRVEYQDCEWYGKRACELSNLFVVENLFCFTYIV